MHINNTFNKKPAPLVGRVHQRKEGDSNPRRCYPQRFSRPPQSTALPSFLPRLKDRQMYKFITLHLLFSPQNYHVDFISSYAFCISINFSWAATRSSSEYFTRRSGWYFLTRERYERLTSSCDAPSSSPNTA